MLKLLQAIYWWVCRVLLRLRYRVRVVGLEQLRDLQGPTLVMPSHPAYIDPPLVMSHLRLGRSIQPVVIESMYRRPALYPFMRLVEALEVPELGEHSRGAREQTLAMIDSVVAGLSQGGWFLIYPSGRAQRRGLEEIGANRAVADVLARCPDVNLVLVRTRGLWGSMFSFAETGAPPNLGQCVLRSLAWMAANLLLFAPRRNVTMTVELVRRQDLPGVERERLNPFLEAWYNAGGPEKPTFVPRHFLFGPRDYEFPDVEQRAAMDLARIKPATITAVDEMVEEHLGRELEEAEKQAETTLEQLGLDSLERMDIAMAIEERFGFHSDKVAHTLGELWALASGLVDDRAEAAQPVPPLWSQAASSAGPVVVLAETLAEAFVRRALVHPGDAAVADELSGVLSYRRLLVGAKLMSRRIASLPGDAVGIMLPASVAADVAFVAAHLAGKLPVLLNWTTGPANLAHAVQTLGVRKVLTARRLVDRLGIEVKGADYVFLEDVRGGIGKAEALATLAATYLHPARFLRDLPRQDPDAAAAVLFTSGSESAPKAVPLSHRNLIHNVRASLEVLSLTPRDAMLGFLPPFHSFGLMGNVIAPLVAGVRMAHFADPTNAAGIVRSVARYRTTLFITTPTFLGYILSAAKPEDLQSVRIIVTGAEKCPDAVFARAAELAPQAVILEGYGITECSPVVSANYPGRIRHGTVGQAVAGVELRVVDPQTHEPLGREATGMLLVHSPSVFAGYLNYDGPDPFLQRDGKRWYVTGDLVQLDDEGFVHFSGRLKRFLKAGGEMISLPALEEPFARQYPPTENGPRVAVEGVETPEGRWIVLFTTEEITPRQANAILAEAGMRGVMRIDEVVRMDAIPVLGTGKTDYKVLRATAIERMKASQSR